MHLRIPPIVADDATIKLRNVLTKMLDCITRSKIRGKQTTVKQNHVIFFFLNKSVLFLNLILKHFFAINTKLQSNFVSKISVKHVGHNL